MHGEGTITDENCVAYKYHWENGKRGELIVEKDEGNKEGNTAIESEEKKDGK